MKSRINGCRKYQKDEKTQEIEDIIYLFPESFIKKMNNYEYTIPLNQDEIICEFAIKDKLGEGAFGSVRLGINKQTGEKVAIKILEKSKLKKIEDKIRIDREIEILKKLKHPNIVQLYCVIETERQIFLIMEYIKGKELFQYIILKKKLPEEEACFYFQQIVSGVEYLQKLKIAHRDIKSENMIIEQNTKNLKILDFGLSNTYGDKPNETLITACGSPCYAAPEMLCGKIYKGKGVDIWSMGVVLFSMICGFLPFHEESNKEMYKKIIEGKFQVPAFISKMGRELIYKLLNTNPKKRINISQIKNNFWIKFYSNGLNNEGKSVFNVGLFINKYVIPIDEEIIDEMEKLFKIPKIKSRNEILLNNSNDYTSLYYLLVNKKIKNGQKSISDFKSELFLSYLEDKKNLLSNYDNNIEKAASIRKMGVLFEQGNLGNDNNKHLFSIESNNSIKSQDNIYNIYFKNNGENKNNNFSTYNSSLNLKNNSNKKFIKSKTNQSLKNNNNKNINLNLLKTLKLKINLNQGINKDLNSDRNLKDNFISKTARNKKNLILKTIFDKNKNKTIQQNNLDYQNTEKNKKTNSFLTINKITLSPLSNKIKSFKSGSKSINRIRKKSSKNEKKESNKKLNRNQKTIVKYSNDEIEEEKFTKSIEEKKDKEKDINNKYELKNYYNNKEKEKKLNLININDEKEINTIMTTNELNELSNKNNNIKYKETISPFIETQKSINNNTLENNKYNYFKTLDSFSILTINQYDSPENKNKFKLELTSLNTFSEREERKEIKTSRKKGFYSYRTTKKIKNRQNTSKLLKNINKYINKINSKNEKKNCKDNNKNLLSSTIKNIIKKIIIDNNNKISQNNRNCKPYKKDKKIKKNIGINIKKISQDNNTESMATTNTIKNNKNMGSSILTKFENFDYNSLSYNKSPSNYKFNNKIFFHLNNEKKEEKYNKIINNIKIENDNSIKNNLINKRKIKSVENEKKSISNTKQQKKINCYLDINRNKIKYSSLKRLNTANNNLKNNNNYFSKLKRNNKLSFSSFKAKTLINKEKKIQYNNIQNYKNKNQKESKNIFLYSNLNEYNKEIKKSENNSNRNDIAINYKNKIKVNIIINDLEPFDLNCISSFPIKIIRNKLVKVLEELKYKTKKINSNKYIIYYGEIENENIYEFNILKNNFPIIKFKKIQGANNIYYSDIRKIFLKINNI